MRITREILRKVASNTVAERTRYNRHLVSIFLTGSLLEEDPLMGGTADVDLIFVHDSEPPFKREIVPVTDDIHVDIGHLPQSTFLQPRALRGEAWLGPFVCSNPLLLHDTQHWFEFTQAVVCASFHQPENVLRRARPLAEKARQAWMSLYTSQNVLWAKTVFQYLNILKEAGNSIACLSGPPLTERRFMLQYPSRASAIGQPEFASTLAALYTGQSLSDAEWHTWLESWEKAFMTAGQGDKAPVRLHPARRNYYRKAAAAMWENDEKYAALWPILHTWTEAVAFGQDQNEAALEAWLIAIQHLGLSEADFAGRMEALDTYLDGVEEALDGWAEEHGV
jgi:hypothetical protein